MAIYNCKFPHHLPPRLRVYSVISGRSSHWRCSKEKVYLKISHKKEILTKVFSCAFCEIFKNIFFTDTSGRLLLIRVMLLYNTRFNDSRSKYARSMHKLSKIATLWRENCPFSKLYFAEHVS